MQEVFAFVKRNLSEAQRRKDAPSGISGSGKGAAALVPVHRWTDPEREQRSESQLIGLINIWPLIVSDPVKLPQIRSCYNVPAMKVIRYGLHFTTLAAAAVLFWLVKDLYLPYWISNFDYFHYALMGALHSTSIVVSLRDRRTTHPIIAFPIYSLGFITLATVLSAWVPFMGLLGSIVWSPFADILRENNLGGDSIFLTGSVIGASGYWLFVRLFWLRSLRRADWLRTVALCVTATLLAGHAIDMFDGYVRGVATLNADIMSPILTVAWWFAFSISLYWSEMSEHPHKSTQAVETVT